MITIAQLRKTALSFPGTEEAEHHGHPDFRVAKKIFLSLRPDNRRAVVKLTIEEQSDLVRTNGEVFALNAWSKQGWTEVATDKVDPNEFRTVLEASWRHVAPKKLVKAFDAES